jgi:Questin oxidase-like
MYRGFVQFFDRELTTRGVEGVFEVYFPSLLDGCLGSHSIAMAHIAFGLENSLPTMISEGMAHVCTTYLDTSDILSVPSSNGMKCDEVLDMIHYDQRFDGRLSLHFVNNVKLLLNSRRDLLRTYMNYMQTTRKSLKILLNNENKMHRILTLNKTVKTISDAQAEIQELIKLAILLLHTPANTTTYSQSPPRSPTNSDMITSFQSTHSVMSGSLLSSAIAVNRIIPYVNSLELVQRMLSFQRLSTICTYIIQGRTPIQSRFAEPTKSLEECKYAILKSGNIQAGITLCDLDYANSLNIVDNAYFLSMVNLLSDGEHTQRPLPKSFSWS